MCQVVTPDQVLIERKTLAGIRVEAQLDAVSRDRHERASAQLEGVDRQSERVTCVPEKRDDRADL